MLVTPAIDTPTTTSHEVVAAFSEVEQELRVVQQSIDRISSALAERLEGTAAFNQGYRVTLSAQLDRAHERRHQLSELLSLAHYQPVPLEENL